MKCHIDDVLFFHRENSFIDSCMPEAMHSIVFIECEIVNKVLFLFFSRILFSSVEMINSNPMLQQMAANNPQMQAMLNNPEMLRMMMNPQMMQASLQMQVFLECFFFTCLRFHP